ncbi:MAG: hypothetical protein F6K28_01540 [Microcoleus sp. SIO2G3]|nr:hypothetical protein [Microcoleus sp. SIO2G3]
MKRSLALREIGKRESIQVSEGEINARVQELLEQYAEKDVDEDRLREVVENELLTEKIIDWLLERSTVELVPEGSLSAAETETETETEEVKAADSEAATETVEQTLQVSAEISPQDTESTEAQ